MRKNNRATPSRPKLWPPHPKMWKIVPNTTKRNQELLLGEKMFGKFCIFFRDESFAFFKVFLGKKRKGWHWGICLQEEEGKKSPWRGKKGETFFLDFTLFPRIEFSFLFLFLPAFFSQKFAAAKRGENSAYFRRNTRTEKGNLIFPFLFISAHPRCGEWGGGAINCRPVFFFFLYLRFSSQVFPLVFRFAKRTERSKFLLLVKKVGKGWEILVCVILPSEAKRPEIFLPLPFLTPLCLIFQSS